jgi:hypothetical protein
MTDFMVTIVGDEETHVLTADQFATFIAEYIVKAEGNSHTDEKWEPPPLVIWTRTK